MKLHIPVSLRNALLIACIITPATAFAGVADVHGTVTYTAFHDTLGKYAGGHPQSELVTPLYAGGDVEEMQAALTGEAKAEKQKVHNSNKNYVRPVVYDYTVGSQTNSSATIENWGSESAAVVVKSGLFVREGELTIKDSNLTTKLGDYQSSIQVSGNNAHLILDNAKMKSASGSTDIAIVGGPDGAGTLTLQGGSEMFVDTWMMIGLSRDTDGRGTGNAVYATREQADSTSKRYSDGVYTDERGAFNAYNSKHCLGKGTLLVTDKSTLTVGGGIAVREADIRISNATLKTCTKYSSGTTIPNGSNEEKTDSLGRSSGSETHVTISDGGKWYSGAWISTGLLGAFEAKTKITVDGAGSEMKASYCLALGYGSADWPAVSSTELSISNGGKVSAGSISLGVDKDRRGANPVYVHVDALSSMETTGKFTMNPAVWRTDYSYGGSRFGVNSAGFEVDLVNEGNITCASFDMRGGNLYSSGTIDISGALTLKDGNITLGIKSQHATTAAISAGSVTVDTADGSDYEVKLEAIENLKAGKYLLIDSDTMVAYGSSQTRAAGGKVTFSLEDDFNGMTVQQDGEGNLYLMVSEQIILVRDPLADAVQAASWGVQKSSQAFTSLLWQPRGNAVTLGATTGSGKEGIIYTTPSQTLAWGAAYSGFSRQSSSSGFSKAEYSLWGGAVGVERQYVSGRSIGLALGYDWGKVSPETTARVKQNSWHAALYGRALEKKLSRKGSVSLDWSAAVGSTTSDQAELGRDWSQNNLQLDVRATYAYTLSDRTTATLFAGGQYYAQEDATTNRLQAGSLQYLRMMLGAGVSYKLTERAELFGEASVYNDTMRHNPDAKVDGFYYGTGANPGRLGGSVTAGAQYRLSNDWTLWGSYSLDGAADNTEHTVNVGASYSF